MSDKRLKIFQALPKAGFLSILVALLALLAQAIAGSPKMAIGQRASLALFFVFFAAFLAVAVLSLVWRPKVSGSGELTVSGPYKFVRYPFYGAIIFLFNPALAIFFRSWFLFFACALVYFIWRMVVRPEEKRRREIFGEVYFKYQKSAWLFFPNLFMISKPLFFGFWALAVFIFIFVGLNFSALYLRAIEWPEEEKIREIGEIGGMREIRGGETGGLPKSESRPKPKYNKPDSIVIGKIKIEAPLVFASGTSKKELNAALDQGVVIYPGSKLPGEPGEVFLTGHSSVYPWNKTPFGQVFTLIDKLEAGDIATLYYGQYKYDYKMTKKSQVKPNEVHLNAQTGQNTLVLMTCWPPGTTLKRLLVEGVEVE